jgi:hypothetical protein
MNAVARLSMALIMGTGSLLVVPALPASAAQTCQGTTYSGRCLTASKVKRHLKVVQSVDLQNRSSRTAVMHCSFTQTITRSVTGSTTLSVGLKGQVLKVVEASTSVDLSKSVTQTASSATTAGGSVTLKRNQAVICQRTYGYVSADIKESTWSGKKGSTRYYTVTVPIRMGVRIIDG